ncbi:GFA family protein [Prodigiosinella confusarubida]|uniref:GFA family protein n=1 Tax=Serratia sp. (strain ATCC 39006) TaxID=104623 RepID=A0A2I5TDU8_SERS3|nr:GFA family protein [Serratia sp. ATCC 39006]AUG98415.1 GFA family protein [Serratia sp. ATCC 39006]AUH02730.1 GFA family protein [Serratia sp. ATCC 39006]
MQTSKGSCLCGAVTITIPEQYTHEVSVCHCGVCRKWGSGPLMAIECPDGVTIEGEENITSYRSSDWAERAFCSKCGTHLFYKLFEPETYEFSAGLFPDGEKQMISQIYIDNKPDYYDFVQQTPMLTEQDVIDQSVS